MAQAKRIQISKDALFEAFREQKEIPEMMQKELSEAPLSHLLSTYVIRPVVFDFNPYTIPKSAPYKKKQAYRQSQDFAAPNQSFKKSDKQTTQPQAPANESGAQNKFQKGAVNQQSAKNLNAPATKDAFDDDFETVEIKQKTKKPFVKKPYDPNFKKNQAFTRSLGEETKEPKIVENSTDVIKKEDPKDLKQKVPEKAPEVVIEEVKKPVQEEVKEEPKPIETPVEVEQEPVKETVVKRKGPKPKGMKKFKQVTRDEEPIPEEELSENQKKKLEAKKKKEEELYRQQQEALEAKRQKEEAERMRVSKEMFERMAENQKKQEQASKTKKQTKAFEDIMKDADAQAKKNAANKKPEQRDPNKMYFDNSYGKQGKTAPTSGFPDLEKIIKQNKKK